MTPGRIRYGIPLDMEKEIVAEERDPDRSLAILGYHKIGPPGPGAWETWNYIPESTFARQLAEVRESGWEVIDAATFLAGLGAPDRLPRRAVLVTFDDGYRSTLTHALPQLRRFGYPGVVFVPTGLIGGVSEWDANTAEPTEPICGWDELKALERGGVSVQSHGVWHRGFSTLDTAGRVDELVRSKARLESGLEKSVDLFAFPYGDDGGHSEATRALLEGAGYRAACLYGGGPNRLPVADPFRWTRLAMGPETDLAAALRQDRG